MSPKALYLLVIYSVLRVGSVKAVLFNELQRLALTSPRSARRSSPYLTSQASERRVEVPRQLPADLLPAAGDETIPELDVQADDDSYTKVFKYLWRACCRPGEFAALVFSARAEFQASKRQYKDLASYKALEQFFKVFTKQTKYEEAVQQVKSALQAFPDDFTVVNFASTHYYPIIVEYKDQSRVRLQVRLPPSFRLLILVQSRQLKRCARYSYSKAIQREVEQTLMLVYYWNLE